MSLGSILAQIRLKRIARRIRVLHTRQRHLRARLEELERKRREGEISPSEFEEKKLKIESRRHETTRKINALVEEEERLKAKWGKAGP